MTGWLLSTSRRRAPNALRKTWRPTCRATYRRLVATEYETPSSNVAAELVQLRVPERKNAPGPKVQEHDASAETDETLQRALERAVTLVSTGKFPAIVNKACSYCQFFSLTCPAQPAGHEVIS